jgi:putative heme iron utilization protein
LAPSDTASEDLATAAVALLHSARNGVLSTLSAQHGGWPFGSLTPYAVAREGALVLVLSDLAEHTRNVRADARASLFVQDPAHVDSPQAGARVCVLGRVHLLEDEAREDARARYVARHPEGEGFLRKLDFRVYALVPEQVRLIGGFGRIAWLPGSVLVPDPARDPLHAEAAGIVAHMNQDHAEVLSLYCAAFRGRAGVQAVMTGIDRWGFDVQDAASGERFRFDFAASLETPEAVRKAVVAMAREARAILSGQGS